MAAGNLSGGALCVKYTLFIFNLLFLLAGLALIIVGAIVQVQATKSGIGGAATAAGIFIIVIGGVIFIIAFFGCAGSVNNNYCMISTYGVLMVIILLAEIAAVIAGFVLKNQVQTAINDEMADLLKVYVPNQPKVIATETWDAWQQDWKCCGINGSISWKNNPFYANTSYVPDSCCVTKAVGCGNQTTSELFKDGCVDKLVNYGKNNLIAVGATAAAVVILEIFGIIFAFCFAHCLRKDYRVVNQ